MRVAHATAVALLYVVSPAHAEVGNATGVGEAVVAKGDNLVGAVHVVLLVVLLVLLSGISYVGWRICRSRREARTIEGPKLSSLSAFGSAGEHRINTWKIIYAELRFGQLLGQGSSGKVCKAEYRGVSVAAKEVVGVPWARTDEEIATSMQRLIDARHPNLVLLMGIARPPQKQGEKGRLFVVSEFMERQSLYSVLHDTSVTLDWKTTIGFMTDVAKALMYMHQSRPPLIHGNLTSRNILVSEDLVCKIGDYGLDAVWNGAAEKQASSLWNAPEVFKKSVRSKATNVFSFGIIMWEMLTRRAPYQDARGAAVVTSPVDMIRLAKEITELGVRPDLPDNTPPALANLLKACWSATPEHRPEPDLIMQMLEKLSKMAIDIAIFQPLVGGDQIQKSQFKRVLLTHIHLLYCCP
jgi:serine/threonine protein kinase